MNKDNKKPDNKDANPESKASPKEFLLSFEEYKSLKEKADLADQYFDKLLRMQAETENIRKRLTKEKEEFTKFANIELISEFVSIMEDFERAVDSAEKNHDTKTLLEGVKMITKHLEDVLKKTGLSKIDQAAVVFDHDKHEAVDFIEKDDIEENTVVEILRKGYILNGRVIRPAMVKVSKKSETKI